MSKQLWKMAALVVLLLAGCGQPNWQEFSSPEGKFTVQMPGKPKSESRTQAPLVFHNFGVELRDSAYLVSYADLPGGGPFDYDAGVQGVANTQNGKVLSLSDFTIDGHTGKAYEIEVTKPRKGSGAGRMVVVNGRLYQLLVIGSNVKASDADVQKFFNSFKLTK